MKTLSQLRAISYSYSKKRARELDEALILARLDNIFNHQTQYKTKQGALEHKDKTKFASMLDEAEDWAVNRQAELSRYNNVSQYKLDEVTNVLAAVAYHRTQL